MVIEVDDNSHNWKDETERTNFLESKGFSILRFDNGVIARELDGVFEMIRAWVEALREGRNPNEE